MSQSFSYDRLLVFPDVLFCFLFDGLVYFCVVIMDRVGDDIIEFSGLLITLSRFLGSCL